jgi:hypothetical protein
MARSEAEWRSPPESCEAAFTVAYMQLYCDGYTALIFPCCRVGLLRLYFQVHDRLQRQGQGLRRVGSWLWCPAC